MNILISRCRATFILSAAFLIFLLPAMGTANVSMDGLADRLRARLETAAYNPVILNEDEGLHAPSVLQKLYRKRAFQPAWIGNDGPNAQAGALLDAIGLAHTEGLKPEEYHLLEIKAIILDWHLSRQGHLPFPVEKQIDLELLLTDALVAYGFHLLNGRVDPERLYSDWFSYEKDIYLYAVITNVMQSGKVETAFQRLTPQAPLYRDLKQTLASYRAIAASGGWPVIPQPRSLMKKAEHQHYLSLLRQRLILTGDLAPSETSSHAYYDENTKKAVRRFQKRHGLKADGQMNPATLKEMNIPVQKRIQQIVLNLERLRWLPEEIGSRYILVNIADFELIVFEDGLPVMDMPIVVGRQNQRTSVFRGKMTYIELNPYWNIPKTIAEKEILPNVQKDPDYLTKKKIKVIEYSRPQGKEVDPATIDWSKIRPDKLRYSFRQDAGPGNALGRIKFMFPNKFDIYLHDTPERHLFKRSRRAFSHGCIRIAKPIDLAEYLLKNENGWDHRQILAEINGGKRQVLTLEDPIDVHILYLTAWTDHHGDVHLRSDIYAGDAVLQQALNEKPRLLELDDVGNSQEIPGPYGESF